MISEADIYRLQAHAIVTGDQHLRHLTYAALGHDTRVAMLPTTPGERLRAMQGCADQLEMLCAMGVVLTTIGEAPIHLINQIDQPYGSTRRCCNTCGAMATPDMKHFTSMEKWKALPKDKRCDQPSPACPPPAEPPVGPPTAEPDEPPSKAEPASHPTAPGGPFPRTVTCVWCCNRYVSAVPAGLDKGTSGCNCASDVRFRDGHWDIFCGYGSENDMDILRFVVNPPSVPADPICDECIRERALRGDIVQLVRDAQGRGPE
jgi:hypothetical protein